MPNRILRDGILTSEAVNSLRSDAELFYRRLMSVVDDYGRYFASVKLLRPACYPLQIDRVREADISRWIAECVLAGLILLYTVDGKEYLVLLKMDPPRAKHSKFPDPPPVDSCAHVRADADTCPHVRPYSNAYSDSNANAKPGGEAGKSDEVKAEIPPAASPDVPGIPPSLNNPDFVAAWSDFQQHRREKREKLTPTAVRNMFAKLERWGPARAVIALRESMANGWTGVFEPKAARMDPKPEAAPLAAGQTVKRFGW